MFFYTAQDYRQYWYKKDLRKTTNSLGRLLLYFFAGDLILSVIALSVIQFNGLSSVYESCSSMKYLLNGMISSAIFFFAAAIYCLCRKHSFARLFPFEKNGARLITMLCVIGLAVSLMSNLVVDAVNGVFGLFGIRNSGGDVFADSDRPSILLSYFTVAILPAFAEEFAFRGVIMGSLRKYSDALALVVSAAAFALMHGNFVQIPFTFCCGLAFGFVVLKTNSLLPSIIIHFLNNALAVTSDVLSSYEIVSDDIINIGYGVIFVITGVLALIFIRRLIREKPDFFTLKNADTVMPFREKLKLAATSPTMIAFEVIMLAYAVTVLSL